MKVEIINPEETRELFKHWSKFSAECYQSLINPEKPEAIGKHCLKSEHFSGSRSRFIEFRITDCPRFTIDQLVRHEQGVVKNVQSFRYVDKDKGFNYAIPVEIKGNEKLETAYNALMADCNAVYHEIYKYLTETGKSGERASEQARYALPISTYSSVTIGLTIEALIHLCHKRLCVRTEDVFRELAQAMRAEVIKLLPILEKHLVPQCKYLLWCPETKSCGAYPKKDEARKAIEELSRK